MQAIIKIKDNFKRNFQRELIKSEEKDFGSIFYVNRSIVRDIALYLLENANSMFVNMSIVDLGNKFQLIYEYFTRFAEPKYWFICTEVNKEANQIDSIEIIYPQAKFYEMEINKRFGLKFISFTEEVGTELFTVPIALEPSGKEGNLAPLGIYNKIHDNNFYFHLQLEDYTDKIISISQKTGWLYRGIIPLLSKKDALNDNIRLTKRISGVSSLHHSLAYVLGIEQLINIKVSEKVSLIRTLACELERIESHLIFFANLFYLLGHQSGYSQLLKNRSQLLNLYQESFKIGNLDELIVIGTIQDLFVNVKKNPIHKQKLKALLTIISDIIENKVNKSSLKDQTKGIGILALEDSLEAGVTGPCLRGSGINYDIRYEKPYLSYVGKIVSQAWEVVTNDTGDVYSRIKTRFWEVKNSIEIIKVVLDELVENTTPINPVDLSKIRLTPNSQAISQVESPQGELTYFLKTAAKPSNTLEGIYICTPSLKNFSALNNYMLENSLFKNFPLIVHSMDLIFTEIDL